MHYRSTFNKLNNSLLTVIIITVAMLPIAPVSAIAAEIKSNETTVVLKDQSKTPSESSPAEAPSESTDTKAETTSSVAAKAKSSEEVVILKDQSKTSIASTQAEKNQEVSSATQTTPSEIDDTKMSTGKKVAIGVGAGVVAIAGIAALSGGSGGSSSTPPTQERMVGVWQGNANSADGRTYTGNYTLYAGGSHTYDIYVSDGRHKSGSGSWTLNEYNLTLRNFNGSTYNGTFAQGVNNTVSLVNSQGTWKLVITK